MQREIIAAISGWISNAKAVTKKKRVLRNFTKFPGKQLCQGFFFNKVAGPQAWEYLFLQSTFGGCFCWYAADLQGEHPMLKYDCKATLLKSHRHECSLANLLHIFRTLFYKNTDRGLLLNPRTSQTYKEKFWEITAIDSRKTDRRRRFLLLSASSNHLHLIGRIKVK